MNYRRRGECNMCGECCGYPKPNGSQNNPWPMDLASVGETWDFASLQQHSVFKYLGHPRNVGRRRKLLDFDYEWRDTLHRLDDDIRCPFLVDKKCGLHSTSMHRFWMENCQPVPPARMDEHALAIWKENCPSCSYEWF